MVIGSADSNSTDKVAPAPHSSPQPGPPERIQRAIPKAFGRFGLVAFAALALQVLVIHGPLGAGDVQRRAIVIVSYVLLLVFVAFNWRHLGIAVIAVGLVLNFLAIASNGGLMPISPENLQRSGLPESQVSLGDWVPRSKDVLLARADTRLWFLSDILVWKNPTGVNVFSIGDVILGAGLVLTLGELFLPRVQRVSRDRSLT